MPSPFVSAVDEVFDREFVIPFAIPPIVARWDRAIKDLRATWSAQGLDDFPIPLYEPPPVEDDSEFDSDDSDDFADDSSAAAEAPSAPKEKEDAETMTDASPGSD